jgi:hypothetical protein
MNNTKIFMTLALASVALACPVFLTAQQDQQESVADAARKAQAARKAAPPAKMVIDDDSLSTLKGTVNVVGGTPSSDQTKAADNAKTSGPAKDEGYWRGKFASAYRKLADDSKELDITQRERNLNQQQYYTDPNAALKQEYSRKDLNDAKTKIDELTAKVAQDKTDISNLEDELRQAGGEPGWATAPSQSSTSESGSGSSQPSSSSQPASSTQPAAGATAPAAGNPAQ